MSQVGAPPEMALLLEEIAKENLPMSNCCQIGADPELDEFMVTTLSLSMFLSLFKRAVAGV